MRITIHENSVLNAVAACHPVKSSLAKIVKATGMARNDVGEVVSGLKKIGYVNVTPKGEVYLMENGRNYLGVSSSEPSTLENNKKPLTKVKVPVKPGIYPVQPDNNKEHEQGKETINTLNNDDSADLFSSIDALSDQLNKPKVIINDLATKVAALERLGVVLSDDIEALLLEVSEDLKALAN